MLIIANTEHLIMSQKRYSERHLKSSVILTNIIWSKYMYYPHIKQEMRD